MIKCCNIYNQYDFIKPKILLKLEEQYINSSIQEMLLWYIEDKDIIEKLKPITKRKSHGLVYKHAFNIQPEEYNVVDVHTLMLNLPIGFLSCFDEISIDVPEFLSRKVIKILKMISSKEKFTLDIIEKTLLFYMINNNGDHFEDSFEFEEKDQLVNLEVECYIKGLLEMFCDDEMNVSTEDDEMLANDIYNEAFYNIYTMLQLEKTGEVNIMFSDFDEDNLIYNGIIDAFDARTKDGIEPKKIINMITEINMSIPFEFVKLCNDSKYPKSALEFIRQVEDITNDLDYMLTSIFEKTNRIIDMPKRKRNTKKNREKEEKKE